MARRLRPQMRLLLPLAAVLMLAVPWSALADPATDQSIHVEGTEPTDTYTSSATVDVVVSATHCPPGGDMQALEVAFSNVSASGPWTVVHAGGTPWPGADPDGCGAGGTAVPATFSWTLAAGADGPRTVYARFKHGQDEVFASDGITLDTTPPTIVDNGPTAGPDGLNGWYVSPVTNRFSASDALSGLADPSRASFTVSSGSAEGSAVKISSGPVSDVAGNTNPGIDSAAFKIDLSNPSVAIVAPANGATTSDASIAVSGSASDAVSGIASVTLNGSAAAYDAALGTFSGSVALACGPNTITALATDHAGRTATHSISVTRTCVSYTARFLPPIDPSSAAAGTVKNRVKNGRVVPVKLEIFRGAAEYDSQAAPNPTIRVSLVSCNGGSDAEVLDPDYADAGASNDNSNEFRWSADPPGFWIYNLDTRALGLATGQCYRIDVYVGSDLVTNPSSQWAVIEVVR